MRYLIFICLLVSFNVSADAVLVNLSSYHFSSDELNQNNLGLGYEFTLGGNSYIAVGAFKNSYDNNSVYSVYGITKDMGKFKIGLEAGLISGYPKSLEDEYDNVNQLTIRGVIVAPYVSYSKIKVFILGESLALQLRF